MDVFFIKKTKVHPKIHPKFTLLLFETSKGYFSDSYLKFEEDFYRYSALGESLTTLTDDILRAMAMGQKNYFKLSKRHSKDGRDHYFYFKVEFSKTELGVRKFEYLREFSNNYGKIEL